MGVEQKKICKMIAAAPSVNGIFEQAYEQVRSSGERGDNLKRCDLVVALGDRVVERVDEGACRSGVERMVVAGVLWLLDYFDYKQDKVSKGAQVGARIWPKPVIGGQGVHRQTTQKLRTPALAAGD